MSDLCSWTEMKKLKKAGFFQELRHGDRNGPSLRESICSAAGDHEAQVIEYLGSGVPMAIAPGVTTDVLSESPRTIGTLSILTDGAWVWPSDLSYYVATYHVDLPSRFLQEMHENGWRVPQENIRLEELEL